MGIQEKTQRDPAEKERERDDLFSARGSRMEKKDVGMALLF